MSMKDMLPGLFGGRTRKRRLPVPDARAALLAEEESRLVDPEQVARLAIERVQSSGILFIDEIDKIAGREGGHGPDVSREGVQRDILPIVEGTTVATKYGAVRTDHVLFIAAGAFHVSKPSDLIPELQGRFPIRVELEPLTQEDLVRILTEPKNALVAQYRALLATDGVDITFTDEAIQEMARFAMQVNAGHREHRGAPPGHHPGDGPRGPVVRGRRSGPAPHGAHRRRRGPPPPRPRGHRSGPEPLHPMRRVAAFLALTAALGCGKRGDPLPPLAKTPQPVRDFAVAQRGSDLEIRYTAPRTTTGGVRLDIHAVEVLTARGEGDFAKTALIEARKAAPGGDGVRDAAVAAAGDAAACRRAGGAWAGIVPRSRRRVTLLVQPPPAAPADLKARLTPEAVILTWTGTVAQLPPAAAVPVAAAPPARLRPVTPARRRAVPAKPVAPAAASMPAAPRPPKPPTPGFRVFRRDPIASYEAPMHPVPITTNAFEDRTADSGPRWCYVVRGGRVRGPGGGERALQRGLRGHQGRGAPGPSRRGRRRSSARTRSSSRGARPRSRTSPGTASTAAPKAARRRGSSSFPPARRPGGTRSPGAAGSSSTPSPPLTSRATKARPRSPRRDISHEAVPLRARRGARGGDASTAAACCASWTGIPSGARATRRARWRSATCELLAAGHAVEDRGHRPQLQGPRRGAGQARARRAPHVPEAAVGGDRARGDHRDPVLGGARGPRGGDGDRHRHAPPATSRTPPPAARTSWARHASTT